VLDRRHGPSDGGALLPRLDRHFIDDLLDEQVELRRAGSGIGTEHRGVEAVLLGDEADAFAQHHRMVLELGCGPGRNAIYLAQKGCSVDAVDLSKEALEWGKERAGDKNVQVNFIQRNIFDLDIEEGQYDFVYDSGCFHHIAPHRRINYLEMVKKALKPEGLYSITCFVEGGILGGTDLSDWDVYRQRSLKGGLGFTEEKLRMIFKEFEVVEIRKMRKMEQSDETFGVQGLWTALFMKR